MNEQTTKLLEQLAEKLGTTSEYLWKVLINQAPIDATVSLAQTIFVFSLGFCIVNIHKKLQQKPNDERTNYDSHYDKYDGFFAALMILLIAVWLILLVVFFCRLDSILSGYFNPEYWALKEILNSF